MKLTISERIYQLITGTIIILVSITCLFPLLYIVSSSLVMEEEWNAKNGFVLWPSDPTLEAYLKVINGTPIYMNSILISIARALAGTVFTLCFTLILGYLISRRGVPGKKALFTIVLITILFPGGLVPTYLVVSDLGLIDNFLVYLIPAMVDSWGVLVFKQFFENMPAEIEESAEIDGASEWTKMVRIVLPMSTAVIAAWALFIAVGHWNSWFDALIYIRSPNLMPVQLLIVNLFNVNLSNTLNDVSTIDPTKRVSDISLRMAMTVMGTLPIMMIYPFLQKHFVKGVYIGAVKG
jgi:putative aldouronate transport system permease protein